MKNPFFEYQATGLLEQFQAPTTANAVGAFLFTVRNRLTTKRNRRVYEWFVTSDEFVLGLIARRN